MIQCEFCTPSSLYCGGSVTTDSWFATRLCSLFIGLFFVFAAHTPHAHARVLCTHRLNLNLNVNVDVDRPPSSWSLRW